MTNVVEAIARLKNVAKLEGWDGSLLDTLLQQYNEASTASKEGISLYLSKPDIEATEYLRIRALRPDVFWEICKVNNDVSMREYVDTRRLAKSIYKDLYSEKKGARKHVQSQ